jgi:hypothetical protein
MKNILLAEIHCTVHHSPMQAAHDTDKNYYHYSQHIQNLIWVCTQRVIPKKVTAKTAERMFPDRVRN